MEKQTWFAKVRYFFSTFFSFYRSAELDVTAVAVAYYLIISIFPILMTLANLLPFLNIDAEQFLPMLKDIFPEQLYPKVSSLVISVLTQPSSSWLGFSIATTLWTISRSMTVLQKAVNKAYGVDRHRDFIISRIVGIFLGIGLQLIITLSVLMIAFGKTLLQMLQRFIQLDQGIVKTLINQSEPAVYLSLFLSLLMLYFFLPNVRIKKIRYILPGAIFVMVVMGTVGKIFGFYVEVYANRLIDFRFVTSVLFLVLMLWFIFMANVLIMGAVLNATVQSLHVEEFHARHGDVVTVLNRIKARFTDIDTETNKK
ncbi:YihY/virulence factor BrkB family protein [Streptococcus oriscaviae]|uniref:YihY/virulence factor BrkB family protein n=1 Tax=Streptococcus oriscaviae TaxID=2781599 RepID=A0ABX7YM86_9STRE|nr:YihY/virulence factor BrkB family protein [Streptococcus oriscaviae]QUE54946.1 YihY/virulence factor BrkB family protein [Streptococcus oriscaviae]